MNTLNKRRLGAVALPVFGAASILLIWQFLVPALGMPAYILPTPLAVAAKLVTDWRFLLENARPTIIESALGFLFGNAVAILLAIVFVHSRTIRGAYFPVVLVFNTIPILALAPIIILIFGLGMLPKVIIAAVICFFPTLVNMVRGLQLQSANEMELMRVLSANRVEVFLHLRLPRSVPLLFASLRIAATSCVIGAIVGEWIGSNQGLGALIIQSTFNYQSDRLFAAVFIASALGLIFYGLVAAVEHRFVRRPR
ncbi:ABC transporter permease [Kaistia dalseonensis]|uniref:NitT/TauT family transport system permease protein n=1 Tax=Kaistia dalseonensis TaxID=410840 RepID=A0ABU0HCW1_9HYPH|nr:ABC transporter permease [Kaistia dalseonensis]MCX5497155.1 ABC transporter permease [Kaistia dalseonensis]MDQ0439782.1 NitT/TauT family transport system permease protein [Kaistia dalseonensis]